MINTAVLTCIIMIILHVEMERETKGEPAHCNRGKVKHLFEGQIGFKGELKTDLRSFVE